MLERAADSEPAGVLWLLPMGALFLFSVAVSVNFALLGAEPAGGLESLDLYVAALSNARMLFVVAAATFSVAVIGSIVYSCFVILRVRFERHEWAAILVGSLTWLLVAWRLEFGRMLGGEYGEALLNMIIERVPKGRRSIDVLDTLLVLTSVAIVFLGAAICALVHPSRAQSARKMAVSTRDFYQLMYLTTGVFLSGMLLTFSVNHWSALLTDEARRPASLALGNGIVLSVGLFYSLMMVIFFVPAALVQMRLIDKLERDAVQMEPGLDLERWRVVYGLHFAPLTAVKTYAVMASPLLGGAIQFLVKPLVMA